MFESLSERIHQDEAREESMRTRMVRYLVVAAIAVGVVAALLLGTRLL